MNSKLRIISKNIDELNNLRSKIVFGLSYLDYDKSELKTLTDKVDILIKKQYDSLKKELLK